MSRFHHFRNRNVSRIRRETFTVADVDDVRNGFEPARLLTDWDVGTVSRLPDGRVLRTFEVEAIDKEIEIAPGMMFPTWTHNGRVPGPSVRVVEFDPISSFHLHANFFDYFDKGTTLTLTLKTVNLITQCQGRRDLIEFTYKDHEPGLYMFHPHQSEFTELGWAGMFDVVDAVA